MHMRFHLVMYIEEHFGLMNSILKAPLEARGMTLQGYVDKMHSCITCGYEITLLALSHIYKSGILVIRPDMLWVSHKIPAIDCPIVIVEHCDGHFCGMKVKKPFYVGSVPRIKLLKDTSSSDSTPCAMQKQCSSENTNTGEEVSNETLLISGSSSVKSINSDRLTKKSPGQRTYELQTSTPQRASATLMKTCQNISPKHYHQ